MSSPESVSSRIASFGSRIAIWRIRRVFFAPGEALVHRAAHELLVHLDEPHLFPGEREEVDRVDLGKPAVNPHRVQRRPQEVHVRHPGDLDRVLEGEEDSLAGALLGRHLGQVPPLVEHFALRHLERVAAREHLRQRVLPEPLGPRWRALAGFHREIDPAENPRCPLRAVLISA
jgi:hypothetical protein